jgi:hypothetical protein
VTRLARTSEHLLAVVHVAAERIEARHVGRAVAVALVVFDQLFEQLAGRTTAVVTAGDAGH